MIPSDLFWFLKIVLLIQGLLCFYIGFKMICSNSMKNAIDTLIRIASNLWIALVSMVILAIWILSIQEHNISFCMFVSSSIFFFHQCLIVSSVQGFASLGRLILRYFILFDVMINRIVSLISLSYISLSVYRNAADFHLLVLHPSTLPNSLINSTSFLVASLGLSMYIRSHLV